MFGRFNEIPVSSFALLQLDAKRKEADYLKEEYAKLQIEYSRFETDRSGYFREVERYGTILKGVHPVNVSV